MNAKELFLWILNSILAGDVVGLPFEVFVPLSSPCPEELAI